MVETSESRDGAGSGDHDTPFTWGNPRARLTVMMQARLLVMRGYVRDHRGAIAGDEPFTIFIPHSSGLYVPTPTSEE